MNLVINSTSQHSKTRGDFNAVWWISQSWNPEKLGSFQDDTDDCLPTSKSMVSIITVSFVVLLSLKTSPKISWIYKLSSAFYLTYLYYYHILIIYFATNSSFKIYPVPEKRNSSYLHYKTQVQSQMSQKAGALLLQSCFSQLHFLLIMCCAPASKG